MGHGKTKGHVPNGIVHVGQAEGFLFQAGQVEFNGGWPFRYKLVGLFNPKAEKEPVVGQGIRAKGF